MIEISKIIVFFAIFKNVNTSFCLFIIIDITLMFINFEIINASFLTFIIFFIKFSKLSDFFRFFKNFIVFDLNFELFNFKAGFFESVCKKNFMIIDIKYLFKCCFSI